MSYPKLMKSSESQAIYLMTEYGTGKCLHIGNNTSVITGWPYTDLRMNIMEDFEIPEVKDESK